MPQEAAARRAAWPFPPRPAPRPGAHGQLASLRVPDDFRVLSPSAGNVHPQGDAICVLLDEAFGGGSPRDLRFERLVRAGGDREFGSSLARETEMAPRSPCARRSARLHLERES